MKIIKRFVEAAIVLVPLLLTCSRGSAQQVDMTVLRLRADSVVDGAQEKLALEALRAFDPGIRLSVHTDRTLLKIGTKQDLDVGTVREVLLQVGIHTSVVTAPLPADGLLKHAGDLPDGFPVFVSTGNPDLDNQKYQAAKAAWIEAHPDAYRQMIQEAPAE